MTTTLLHYVGKRMYHSLWPFLENRNVELSIDLSAFETLLAQSSPLSCACCGWKGGDRKAKKHYLFADKIAEVELFCPKCNHYLGFISDPIDTH